MSNTEKFEGEVKIASQVIEQIAIIATKEVDGVASVGENSTKKYAKKVGINIPLNSVKITRIDNHVKIEEAVSLKYGVNILETCSKIQEKVKTSVENMTGFIVKDVNIKILDVEYK